MHTTVNPNWRDVISDAIYDSGWAERTANEIVHRSRSTAPVDTGVLRMSHIPWVTRLGPDIVIRVEAQPFYARAVHQGRGPVRAVNAHALRFKVGGVTVYRKSVGPSDAQPWLYDVLVELFGEERAVWHGPHRKRKT